MKVKKLLEILSEVNPDMDVVLAERSGLWGMMFPAIASASVANLSYHGGTAPTTSPVDTSPQPDALVLWRVGL